MSLTLPLAVEKVFFRLALQERGVVTLGRAFLELPLSLEEVEQYGDQVADGISMLKNEWGEFLSYEFPELMEQMPTGELDGCPVCTSEPPPAPTEGGVEVRRALVCDRCYGKVRALAAREPDETVMERLRAFFREEEEEDPRKVAEAEHEIFYLGLRLGVEQFTHTSIAAQSRLPSSQIKERLDRMGARRYVQVGLLPSGDAVAYRFPPGLTYPREHFRRLEPPKVEGVKRPLDVEVDAKTPPKKGLTFFKPTPKAAPKKPDLKITIKARRTRGR